MSENIKNAIVVGSSGAIGSAFVETFARNHPEAKIHAFSRKGGQFALPNIVSHIMDYACEDSIERCAELAYQHGSFDRVVVATGLLHSENVLPEKSLSDLSQEKFRTLFEINTILPAILAKYFIPKLSREHRSIFAVLSARVGSISDNNLGGWYAYRSSKAALNMVVKTTAIEASRSNRQAVVIGLHPGTVRSHLSEPFSQNVPEEKLFTPEYSVEKLDAVLDSVSIEQSGKCLAWDGSIILP